MNKEQVEQLLDISAEHSVKVPEYIIREWEKLSTQEFAEILEAMLQQIKING